LCGDRPEGAVFKARIPNDCNMVVLREVIRADGSKQFKENLCCMAISLALMDPMMVIRMTEACSPKKLNIATSYNQV
jgi:hypothetical protein